MVIMISWKDFAPIVGLKPNELPVLQRVKSYTYDIKLSSCQRECIDMTLKVKEYTSAFLFLFFFFCHLNGRGNFCVFLFASLVDVAPPK